MGVQGPFKVSAAEVFPHGCGVVGGVSAASDFDASTRENRVQARDKETGLPVWVVDVMDFDPDARERTFKVKITADIEPVVHRQQQVLDGDVVVLEIPAVLLGAIGDAGQLTREMRFVPADGTRKPLDGLERTLADHAG